MNRNMKRIKELADMLKAEGREVTSENINNKAMGFLVKGAHEAGRYSTVTPGEAGKYIREHHNKPE